MSTIPIFFSFDNNYVAPAAVAFFSLLNRAKNGIHYEMYVLHSDISDANQALLQSVVARFSNGKLQFINTEGFLKEEWNNGTFYAGESQFTADTIIRCFCEKFFPQYDKIIYSDVDVVFMDDISELWDVDLSGKYIAAVKNAFMKYDKHELSHLKRKHYKMLKDSYFGGGIWVLNLSQIRQDKLENRILDIIHDPSIVKRWNDQDIMNIACENKVVYLPLNFIAYPYMLDYLQRPLFKSHYSREELWDSFINPKIIHYAYAKPWKTETRYSDLWYDIFFYLGLDPAFLNGKTELENRYQEKYKKYRKLFFAFLFSGLAIILFLLVLLFYVGRMR